MEKKNWRCGWKISNVNSLITATVYNLKIGEVENKILTLVVWSRKWIIALKNQTLKQNILLNLIMINLQVKQILELKTKEKGLVDK